MYLDTTVSGTRVRIHMPLATRLARPYGTDLAVTCYLSEQAPTQLAVATTTVTTGKTATLEATLTTDTGTPIAGKSVAFALSGISAGSGVTNASGVASVSVGTAPGGPVGPKTVAASFAGDSDYAPSSGVGTLQVNAPTAIWISPVAAMPGETVTLIAHLYRLDNNGAVAGRTVVFSVGAWSGSGTTSSGGWVSCPYTLPMGSTGKFTVSASFAGDTSYLAETRSRAMPVVSTDATTLQPLIGGAAQGEQALLRARLVTQYGSVPVAGQSVSFAIGAWNQTVTTDADGWAICFYGVAADATGPLTVSMAFAGAAPYLSSSATAPLNVTAKIRASLYVLPVSGAPGDTVMLKASLYRTNSNGTVGIGGKSVRMTIGAFTATDTTTIPKGWANIPFTIPAGATGTLTITATFDGDGTYTGCTRTGILTVTAP